MGADDPGVVSACDGQSAEAGMCLPTCEDADCPIGSSCTAGVCTGIREASAVVAVDVEIRHQPLIGFGASLGYAENLIANHPNAGALFDAMFLESGFDLIRLRNKFADDEAADLTVARDIISEAADRLDRDPTLFLTSGSPPAALKANGNQYCANSDVECTLARDGEDAFDYAGFAEYWRASLEAYASVGLVPDFVSIQNNVDWVPEDELANEACRFLPQEGTLNVSLPDGSSVDAEFPGYDLALTAVIDSLATLPDEYVLAGPETASTLMATAYSDVLSNVGAIGYHLYGTEPETPDVDQLQAVGTLSTENDRPVIQSEMQAGGLDTAVFVHHAFTFANTGGYLQLGFVDEFWNDDSPILIGTEGDSFEKLPPYHALAHYSRSTSPGWLRVEATSDEPEILATSWVSPEDDALTVVLVNSGGAPRDVELRIPSESSSLLDDASVVRTTFNGVERSSELGSLASNRVVRVPASAVVTIAGGGS